ncbi:hypothetical protein HID58_020210 [Brassica napus]|uniref:Uncharacterized protein n=1 Tax=Brassica napus TaxID=3708 RepID=A0ABQ8DEZ6_BRANA|nr:hypothetical protein HID58_020210 [Brassica napus]
MKHRSLFLSPKWDSSDGDDLDERRASEVAVGGGGVTLKVTARIWEPEKKKGKASDLQWYLIIQMKILETPRKKRSRLRRKASTFPNYSAPTFLLSLQQGVPFKIICPWESEKADLYERQTYYRDKRISR